MKIISSLLLSFFVVALFLSFSNASFAQVSYGDADGDGVADSKDNCPKVSNSNQIDLNNNNIGDACESNILGNNGVSTTQNTKTTYDLLAPLPGLEGTYNTVSDCPLGKYLSILFNLFLGIAAVLAMIMIFAGGIEYMTSELISSKESGMSKVKGAIGGLVLALAAYLILHEINPKLLNICLGDIPKATITIEDIGDEATTLSGSSKVKYNWLNTYGPNNSCPGQAGKEEETCVKLSSVNLPKKYDQSLEKSTLQKMLQFKNAMAAAGISWQITEAWPPTSGHSSKCHGNGTCLDLNIIGTATPESIRKMLNGLQSLGMCPNYEIVPGGLTQSQLNTAGIPDNRIWKSKGTGAHIHVVNAGC